MRLEQPYAGDALRHSFWGLFLVSSTTSLGIILDVSSTRPLLASVAKFTEAKQKMKHSRAQGGTIEAIEKMTGRNTRYTHRTQGSARITSKSGPCGAHAKTRKPLGRSSYFVKVEQSKGAKMDILQSPTNPNIMGTRHAEIAQVPYKRVLIASIAKPTSDQWTNGTKNTQHRFRLQAFLVKNKT